MNIARRSPAENAGAFFKAELIRRKAELPPELRKGYRVRVAEALCVDLRTLSRYCKEIHSVDVLCDVAEYLNVSMGDMLSYGEDVPCVFFAGRLDSRFRAFFSGYRKREATAFIALIPPLRKYCVSFLQNDSIIILNIKTYDHF